MADQALLDRLKRYSMKCLTERTDGDFAEAVWEGVEVIDGLLNDLQEALDTVDELQSQLPKWIPVTERLPEQNTRVIGFMAWKGITAIEYQHGKWYSIDHLQPLPNEAVTHWMPLPEPPKEETV